MMIKIKVLIFSFICSSSLNFAQCVSIHFENTKQINAIQPELLSQLQGPVFVYGSKSSVIKKLHKAFAGVTNVSIGDDKVSAKHAFVTIYDKNGLISATQQALDAAAIDSINQKLLDKNYYYSADIMRNNDKVIALNHEFKELTIASADDTSKIKTSYIPFDKLYPNLSPIKAKQHRQLMKEIGVILKEDTEIRGIGVKDDKVYAFTNYNNAFSEEINEIDLLSTYSCVQEIDAKGNVLQVFPVNYRSDLYAIKYLNQVIGDSLVILFDYNDKGPSNQHNPIENYFIVRYKRSKGSQSYEFLDKLPLPINQYAKEMYGLSYNKMFNTGYPYFTSTYGNEIYNSVRNSFIKLQDDKQYMATFKLQKQKNASLEDSYQRVGIKALGYFESSQQLYVVHQVDSKTHVSIYDQNDQLIKRVNLSDKLHQQLDKYLLSFDLSTLTLIATNPFDRTNVAIPIALLADL